jgi:hypothetical protein
MNSKKGEVGRWRLGFEKSDKYLSFFLKVGERRKMILSFFLCKTHIFTCSIGYSLKPNLHLPHLPLPQKKRGCPNF